MTEEFLALLIHPIHIDLHLNMPV